MTSSPEKPVPSNATLADRALARLRSVADGNGLDSEAITLVEIQEDIFTLGGVMEVTPMSEVNSISYPGAVKGKGKSSGKSGSNPKRVMDNIPSLNEAVAQHRQRFHTNPDWISLVTKEIKAHPSQGWGLEQAQVTLPERSAVYAVTETCPSCQGRQLLTCTQCSGQGNVPCTQCQGRGREPCYFCMGHGENPQQPGQPCPTCHGTRMAPCRFCQTHGHLPCPTCHGQRGTPCPQCQGQGRISHELTVTCGAETHFKIMVRDLPSGLRRSLDRIGIANLGKGYADIASTPPPVDGENAPRDSPPFPILSYRVQLPYAELRLNIGGKKAVISAFGKRCALMGVPAFLDISLEPWRDKLYAAALGQGDLAEAMSARAIAEITAEMAAGRGRIENIRKLYPFGLSADAMKSILADTRLALNRVTLKTRSIIALLGVSLCGVAFYILVFLGVAARISATWGAWGETMLDSSIFLIALLLSWMALNVSTLLVLRRRFPQLKVSLQQKTGKTGLSMLFGIVVLFAASLALSPLKPLWLEALLHQTINHH